MRELARPREWLNRERLFYAVLLVAAATAAGFFLFGRAASFRPTKIFSLIFLEELGKIARREGLFYWGAHKQLVARVWGKIFENARERDLFT